MPASNISKDHEFKKLANADTDNEHHSDESASTDEGANPAEDYCQKLSVMFQVSNGKQFELDSRVGLNGGQTCWNFPCLLDSERKMFFVWLGEISIEKFTKTTFLNIVNFAENAGAN